MEIQGSLCGLAAVHLAARDALLSRSQLAQLSYDQVKAALGAQVGLSEADSKKLTDQEILTQFYTGENLFNVSDQ